MKRLMHDGRPIKLSYTGMPVCTGCVYCDGTMRKCPAELRTACDLHYIFVYADEPKRVKSLSDAIADATKALETLGGCLETLKQLIDNQGDNTK